MMDNVHRKFPNIEVTKYQLYLPMFATDTLSNKVQCNTYFSACLHSETPSIS